MTTSSPLTSTRDRAQQANLSLAWKEGTWYCVNDTSYGSHALYLLCEDHKSTDEFHAIWKEAKGCSRKMRRSEGTVVRLHKARGSESLGNARYKWYAFVRKPLHDVYKIVDVFCYLRNVATYFDCCCHLLEHLD